MKKVIKSTPGLTMAVDNRMQKLGLSRYRLANDLAPKIGSNGPALAKRLVGLWSGREYLSLDLIVAVLDEVGLELTISDKGDKK